MYIEYRVIVVSDGVQTLPATLPGRLEKTPSAHQKRTCLLDEVEVGYFEIEDDLNFATGSCTAQEIQACPHRKLQYNSFVAHPVRRRRN